MVKPSFCSSLLNWLIWTNQLFFFIADVIIVYLLFIFLLQNSELQHAIASNSTLLKKNAELHHRLTQLEDVSINEFYSK